MLCDGHTISGSEDEAESDDASVNALLAGLESDSEAGDPSRKNLLAELQESDDEEDKPAELQESPGQNLLAQLQDTESEQDDDDDDDDDAFLAGLDSDGETGDPSCKNLLAQPQASDYEEKAKGEVQLQSTLEDACTTEVNGIGPPSVQANTLRRSSDSLAGTGSDNFRAPLVPATASRRSIDALAGAGSDSSMLHDLHGKHDSTIIQDSKDGEEDKDKVQQQPIGDFTASVIEEDGEDEIHLRSTPKVLSARGLTVRPSVAMPHRAPFEDSPPTHLNSIRPPLAPATVSSRSNNALIGRGSDGIRPPFKTAAVSSRSRSHSGDLHSRNISTIECVTASVVESDDDGIGVLQDIQDISDLEAFGRLAHRSTTLNLQDLRLSSLEPLGLQSLTSLKTLVLTGNEFADAQALALSLGHLRALTDLDISRCRLRELPILEHLHELRRIDASANALKTSRGILYCTELRQVLLSHNQLRRVEQLETLSHLEELDVSHNRLGPTTLAAMRAVAACARIRVLLVTGNPFSGVRAHHVQLTDLIPSLELIDGRRVQTLRCRSGCITPSRTSRPNAAPVKGVRCQPRVPGRRSNAENRSLADTSISYSLLARNSPVKRPAQRKAPRYVSPTQSYNSHLGSSHLVNSCENSPAQASQGDSKTSTQRNQSAIVDRSLGGPSLSISALEPSMDTPSQGINLSQQAQTSTGVDRGQPSMDSCQPVLADTSMDTPSQFEASMLRCHPVSQARPDAENDTREKRVSPAESSPGAKDKAPQLKQDVPPPSSSTTAEHYPAVAVKNDSWRVTAERGEKAKPGSALQELLEAKHRLLRKVTAQLSGTPQPAACTVSVPALLDSVTQLAPSRNKPVPLVGENAQVAPVAMKAGSDLTTLRAAVRTESLRASLRDGIERKRALLEQLRRI